MENYLENNLENVLAKRMSFGTRFGAWVVDIILIVVLSVALGTTIGAMFGLNLGTEATKGMTKENAELANTKAEWETFICIKPWGRKEDRYKTQDRTITFDSLRTKYNLLLDEYKELGVAYTTFKFKSDSVTPKNLEAIMTLVDEYKMLRDSTKKSSK